MLPNYRQHCSYHRVYLYATGTSNSMCLDVSYVSSSRATYTGAEIYCWQFSCSQPYLIWNFVLWITRWVENSNMVYVASWSFTNSTNNFICFFMVDQINGCSLFKKWHIEFQKTRFPENINSWSDPLVTYIILTSRSLKMLAIFHSPG